MTNSETDDWRSVLPKEIMHRAFASGRELAWPREDALQVVGILQSRGFIITDMEVWLATRPGPTPTMDEWRESDPISAIEFVTTFAFAANDPAIGLPPYFNIWVDEE